MQNTPQMKIQPKNNFIDQNQIQMKQQSQQESIVQKSLHTLQSIPFQIFITLLTIYSLFADDIRTIAFTKEADIGFDVVGIILIIIFTLQIIWSCLVVDHYNLSFFFFLDIISTLSLLFDITLLTNLIYNNNADNLYSFDQISIQTRTSRVATRAVRIVKLIRIIRIVKLYKTALKATQIKNQRQKKQEKKRLQRRKKLKRHNSNDDQQSIQKIQLMNSINQEFSKNNGQIVPEDKIMQKDQIKKQIFQEDEDKKNTNIYDTNLLHEVVNNQSKISQVLSNMTLKKVIIVVLLIMFLVPLFDSDNYIDNANSFDFTVKNIAQLLKKPNNISLSVLNGLIQSIIDDHMHQNDFIVYFSSPFMELPFYQHEDYSNSRISQLVYSTQIINITNILNLRSTLTLRKNLQDIENNSIIASINFRSFISKQAWFSIAKTLFVCIILIGLLHFFSNDIDQMIVMPIQNMMKKLLEMAKDPQSASKQEIDSNAHYETTIVMNAIIKIGALLSIVFGSAGAEIIGSNIIKQGDMNPMIQGKKKCAIFGFCDIRNFTEVTEVLQEDILLFVNKIGSLVHESVYRYGGSANKNIGQAFLLVWKIPDDKYAINYTTNEIDWKDKKYLSVLADFSVLAFIKAIIKINKDHHVLQYSKDQALIEAIPDFKVQMGFGLHIGWAIQGAIGSQYKIDASYLSPNVNMASRLQAATRQFGVNFLLSQDLYNILTVKMQNYCRNIDRVTVKGSKKPIKLYTIDLNLEKLTPSVDKSIKYAHQNEQQDAQSKRALNMQFLKSAQINNYDTDEFILGKKQLRQVMIQPVPKNFILSFNQGLKCYLDGNWKNAKLHFMQATKMMSKDGPTQLLLKYMSQNKFQAPENWQNYRQLTSK